MSSFVEEFLRNPAAIGSLFPSSQELMEQILAPLDFAAARCIVEYGPGTGVFTDALLARRRPATALVLLEVNPFFARQLQLRYAAHANVHVVHGSAEETGAHLARLGLGPADYVVCGLPFSSLPKPLSQRIVAHTRQVLAPAGRFILFQYSLRNRQLFEEHFRLRGHARVLRNLPPAHVLEYEPRPAPLTSALTFPL